MIKYFASLLLIIILISCNNPQKVVDKNISDQLIYKDGLLYTDSLSTTPFTGRLKSRMRNMKIEYEVVNGIQEGNFIIYFYNDKIQMIGKMKENKNVGEWKYYFPSGALQTSGFFENDIPNGKWIWYYKDGRVSEEGNFLNGIREGEWKSYDSLGRIEILRTYKEGKIMDSTKIG